MKTLQGKYAEKLEKENKELKEKLKEVKKILLCGFDTQTTIFKALGVLNNE